MIDIIAAYSIICDLKAFANKKAKIYYYINYLHD